MCRSIVCFHSPGVPLLFVGCFWGDTYLIMLIRDKQPMLVTCKLKQNSSLTTISMPVTPGRNFHQNMLLTIFITKTSMKGGSSISRPQVKEIQNSQLDFYLRNISIQLIVIT